MPFEPIKHPTEAKQETSEVPANTTLPSSNEIDEESSRSKVKFSGLLQGSYVSSIDAGLVSLHVFSLKILRGSV
jgi:hypothetical protein